MKNLITKEEKDRIDLICNEYYIKNYVINSDGSIDVDADVNLINKSLRQLPLRFGKVRGNFYCSLNKLTSLEGSPISVGATFNCTDNKLTSLVGGPESVGENFACSYNKLTNLIGAPTTVGGDFTLLRNKLTSTYSGDIDIDVSGKCIYTNKPPLPHLLLDNDYHINLILKYQRHFFIWNDDLSLNEENFKDLISEIEDGLQ
jgi:hypothetical protein